MNRRDFISSLAAGFYATALFKVAPLHADTVSASNIDIHSVVTNIFSNTESAKKVGQHYIDAYPDRAKKDILLHDSGVHDLNQKLTNENEIKRLLLKKQRTDFKKGNTVTLDHWVLSRSEASLCALLLFS